MNETQEKRFRQHLLDRVAEIRSDEEGTCEDRAPVTLDQQSVGRLSRMDALQVQAMALEASRRRASELRRIEAALARMDAGDYGFCIKCGEEIPVRRLEFNPATPYSVECASGR